MARTLCFCDLVFQCFSKSRLKNLIRLQKVYINHIDFEGFSRLYWYLKKSICKIIVGSNTSTSQNTCRHQSFNPKPSQSIRYFSQQNKLIRIFISRQNKTDLIPFDPTVAAVVGAGAPFGTRLQPARVGWLLALRYPHRLQKQMFFELIIVLAWAACCQCYNLAAFQGSKKNTWPFNGRCSFVLMPHRWWRNWRPGTCQSLIPQIAGSYRDL